MITWRKRWISSLATHPSTISTSWITTITQLKTCPEKSTRSAIFQDSIRRKIHETKRCQRMLLRWIRAVSWVTATEQFFTDRGWKIRQVNLRKEMRSTKLNWSILIRYWLKILGTRSTMTPISKMKSCTSKTWSKWKLESSTWDPRVSKSMATSHCTAKT